MSITRYYYRSNNPKTLGKIIECTKECYERCIEMDKELSPDGSHMKHLPFKVRFNSSHKNLPSHLFLTKKYTVEIPRNFKNYDEFWEVVARLGIEVKSI
jgi:hypothetical protein